MKKTVFVWMLTIFLSSVATSGFCDTFYDDFDDNGNDQKWEQIAGSPSDWYYAPSQAAGAAEGNMWLYGKAAGEDSDDAAIAAKNINFSTEDLTIQSRFGMIGNNPGTGNQETSFFFGENGIGDSATGYFVKIERTGHYWDQTLNKWGSYYTLEYGNINSESVGRYYFEFSYNWFDLTIKSYSDYFDIILYGVIDANTQSLLKSLNFSVDGTKYGRVGVATDEDGTVELSTYKATGSTSPVPEPTTIFLFGSGLVGLAGASRRKKR